MIVIHGKCDKGTSIVLDMQSGNYKTTCGSIRRVEISYVALFGP